MCLSFTMLSIGWYSIFLLYMFGAILPLKKSGVKNSPFSLNKSQLPHIRGLVNSPNSFKYQDLDAPLGL